MSEWEEFAAYAGIIADAKREERERIIKLLEAKYATYPVEKWLDEKALILTLIALIKGENK